MKSNSPLTAGWKHEEGDMHSKEILHHGTDSKEHHMLWVQPHESGKGYKWSVMHHQGTLDTPKEVASGTHSDKNGAKIDALHAYSVHRSKTMKKALSAT